ncbi:MAG: PadR family transcriptional regulator [Roseburia faecis]
MNNKSNFRRGSVELLILHLLSQQDYYGYEISTLIREQTDGYLNIPVGSLYPALYKLIDAGYISDYKNRLDAVGECLLSPGRQWPHASSTTFGGLLRDCQCDPTGIEIYGYTGGRRGRQ